MATTRPARSDSHLPPGAGGSGASGGPGALVLRQRCPETPGQAAAQRPIGRRAGGAVVESPATGDELPELRKLRDLEAKPQKLVLDGGDANGEEYMETQYYDGINCIYKQHHTTGTGFIEVGRLNTNGSSFKVTTVAYSSNNILSCRSNPATNDWIPSSETFIPVSNKPSRRDS